MTAHCRSPQSCSVCLGATARRVELADGVVTIDGVEMRGAEPAAMSMSQRASSARGAAATKRARGKR